MQIVYAAVILAGYVAYFAPEMLHMGRPSPDVMITSHNKSSSAAAGPLGTQHTEQEMTADASSDQAITNSPTHSMQLRNRKTQIVEETCDSEDNLSAATHLLDPRILRLCGSFTLQVRHRTASSMFSSSVLILQPTYLVAVVAQELAGQ